MFAVLVVFQSDDEEGTPSQKSVFGKEGGSESGKLTRSNLAGVTAT